MYFRKYNMWNYIVFYAYFILLPHFTSILTYFFINFIKVLVCSRWFSIRTNGSLNHIITIIELSLFYLATLNCVAQALRTFHPLVMLELQSTDSENKCFEGSIGNHEPSCFSTVKQLVHTKAKIPLVKAPSFPQEN